MREASDDLEPIHDPQRRKDLIGSPGGELGLEPGALSSLPIVTTSDFLVLPIMSILIFEGAISS